MSKIRVALVTPELHRLGGTERSLVEQVERWRDRFQLTIVSSRTADVDAGDARAVHIPAGPGPHLLRYCWWFVGNSAVRRWRSRDVDLVVSPGINCLDADAIGVHILFGKYWERVRVRLAQERKALRTMPAAVHRSAYAQLIRRLERRVYSGPALLWSMSAEDAREIEARFGRPRGSVVTVPNGVDAEAFSPERRDALRDEARAAVGVGADDRLLLLVGNDLNKKGADFAMAALCLLPSYVRLAVAGRVSSQEVAELAVTAGVSDRVVTLPHVEDPMRYYAAADLLLAPSREDSFHLPAIEAMACGLPVVVSAKAGVSELIRDGNEALVLHDPSDLDAMARAVSSILDDADLAAGLAKRGRAFAESRSWDANAERAAELIEREATTPRMLVLAPDARGVGGIQRVTRSLTQALSEAFGEDRIGIVSLRGGELPVRGRVLREGASGGPGRVSLLQKAAFASGTAWTARRWRRRLAMVAAHPHLAPVAWAARLLSDAPYAVWCHGIEAWRPPSPAVGFALRRANVVFAPSRFTARRVEQVARLHPGSVRVIPHALPGLPDAPPRTPGPRPAVLTVARLTSENRYKGVDTLISAWPRVRSEIDAELVIVGDGPDRTRLAAIARLLGVEDSVRFTGRLSDEELARAYGSASVFALPGRHRLEPTPEGEGFGLVYVEAGARGLPVVASPGGGVDDVVRDGENGLLVDPKDAGDVARAIVTLLRDPALAARLGEEGRRLASTEFSADRFRERIVSLVLDDLRPRGLVR